jgi:ParB family transcriptional regulator, chromosome partitioning protein
MLDAERDTEISLAENEMRQAMHPADQFDAFKALADQGMGVADIAVRFGVSALIVKQRLKLASVSPVLMVLYREDGPTLDQLTAFTVGDDHATQERAWFEAAPFDRQARPVRRYHGRAVAPLYRHYPPQPGEGNRQGSA